ncbi:hypothetical protein AAY473_004654 [Plecturocebus cupreus]
MAGRCPEGEQGRLLLRLPRGNQEGPSVRGRMPAGRSRGRAPSQGAAGRVLVGVSQDRREREGLLQPRSRPGIRTVGAAGPEEAEQCPAPGRRRRPNPNGREST